MNDVFEMCKEIRWPNLTYPRIKVEWPIICQDRRYGLNSCHLHEKRSGVQSTAAPDLRLNVLVGRAVDERKHLICSTDGVNPFL